MRPTSFLLFTLLLACLSTHAQSPSGDFKYGLKLSNQTNILMSRIYDANGNKIAASNIHIFNPVPGFLIRTQKGNFLDFTLQSIVLNSSGKITSTTPNFHPFNIGLNVKAGYFYSFFKAKSSHWVSMLGLELTYAAGSSKSRAYKSSPTLSPSGYVNSYQSMGLGAALTPRIMWFPGKRFFMDGSLNLNIVNLTYYHSESSDPNFAYFNRKRVDVRPWRGDRYQIQIGLGVKL